MAILEGVHPQPDTPDLLMPGFARELSDQQIATLGRDLVQRYGNPSQKYLKFSDQAIWLSLSVG